MIRITEMSDWLQLDFALSCLKHKVFQQVTFTHWLNLQRDWLEFGDAVFEDLPEFE